MFGFGTTPTSISPRHLNPTTISNTPREHRDELTEPGPHRDCLRFRFCRPIRLRSIEVNLSHPELCPRVTRATGTRLQNRTSTLLSPVKAVFQFVPFRNATFRRERRVLRPLELPRLRGPVP
jgi:hypothetical protein